MLANLLPGIREIRAPLAAGYIWVVALWIAFFDYIPKRSEAQGVWKSAYQLSATVGTPATLAAVSFTAYLIGSLLEIRARSIVHWFRLIEWWWIIRQKITKRSLGSQLNDPRMLQWAETPATIRGPADPHAPLSFVESWTGVRRPEWGSRASRSALIDLAVHIRHIGGRGVDLHSAMGRFGSELDQLAIRLQVRNADLYGTYDRATAEADLRVNVGLSSSALVIAVAVNSSPSVFLLLPCTWLLIMRGQQKARDANDVLIQAVVSGELESTILSAPLPQIVASSMDVDEDQSHGVPTDATSTESGAGGSTSATPVGELSNQ
ncbi:hypothetical protein [Streptomyces sp. NPDC003667]